MNKVLVIARTKAKARELGNEMAFQDFTAGCYGTALHGHQYDSIYLFYGPPILSATYADMMEEFVDHLKSRLAIDGKLITS